MNLNDMTEQAYRNGYAKGYADAKKNEKHGWWEKRTDVFGFVRCSVCHDCNVYDDWADGKKWQYCPQCGAIMDLPNITENTRKALEKMGENVHSEIDFDYAAEDE